MLMLIVAPMLAPLTLACGLLYTWAPEINSDGRMRTVDWRKLAAGRSRADEVLSPQAAAMIANKNDADLFVVGTVNEAVGNYRITGSLYSTYDPVTPQIVATVQCDSETLFEAVDTLAVRLMTPNGARGKRHTTESVVKRDGASAETRPPARKGE